jgi:acetyl esterase
MPLDADARAFVELLLQAFPGGLHAMPIPQARQILAEGARVAPPGPEVARVEDRSVPAGDRDVPVRIYWPSEAEDQPVLIWLHGGAFALGDLAGADVTCRELASAAGVAVVSVDYRLAPEHRFPSGVEDGYAVLEWVAEHGGDLGLDTNRVAVGGDSAGGTLAAAIALMARDRGGPRIAFQFLAYPTTLMRISSYEHVEDPVVSASMVTFFWGQYVRTDADLNDPYCAPMRAESLEGLPPAFLMIPEVDTTRGDQEAYAHRLAASGVLTTHKVYPGTPHGFLGMTAGVAKARVAVDDAARMLRAALHQAA